MASTVAEQNTSQIVAAPSPRRLGPPPRAGGPLLRDVRAWMFKLSPREMSEREMSEVFFCQDCFCGLAELAFGLFTTRGFIYVFAHTHEGE